MKSSGKNKKTTQTRDGMLTNKTKKSKAKEDVKASGER